MNLSSSGRLLAETRTSICGCASWNAPNLGSIHNEVTLIGAVIVTGRMWSCFCSDALY